MVNKGVKAVTDNLFLIYYVKSKCPGKDNFILSEAVENAGNPRT
jgi:hypothetical protein